MTTHDLATMMREGEPARSGHVPDPARIRQLGRRRRTGRRLAAGAAIVAVVGVVGGSMIVGGLVGGGSETVVGPAAPDHETTGLSSYERRVLKAIPDAYAVDGTVVVPGPVDFGSDMNHRFRAKQIVGAVRPLGFDAFTGVGYLASTQPYPRFMQGNPPKNTQVTADNGPVYLTCTHWPGSKDCTVSMVVKDVFDRAYYVMGMGADDFLDPGAEMEVFTMDNYEDKVFSPTVIGGFDGTTATRVDLELVDGRTVPATVDSGTVHHGDTLFWAKLPAQLAKVKAYDADGKLVAHHTVRACSGGVDCEVR